MFIEAKVSEKWSCDLSLFQTVFTNCSFGISSRFNWMEGELLVEIENGRSIGPFKLRIEFSDEYYRGEKSPAVYLLSHRGVYKNIGDYHIEKDWKLCLYIDFESHIDFSSLTSFQLVLERLGSFMYDLWLYHEEVKKIGPIKAKWPGKQRKHNMAGVIEACVDKISSLSDSCACGSGKSFEKCHGRFVDLKIEELLNAR